MVETETAKHTPVPWFVNGPGHIQAQTPIIGNRSNGEPIPGNPVIIAKILSDNPMDEEFILRACNSHDDLLRACEAVMAAPGFEHLSTVSITDLLIAAIDKAKVKP